MNDDNAARVTHTHTHTLINRVWSSSLDFRVFTVPFEKKLLLSHLNSFCCMLFFFSLNESPVKTAAVTLKSNKTRKKSSSVRSVRA